MRRNHNTTRRLRRRIRELEQQAARERACSLAELEGMAARLDGLAEADNPYPDTSGLDGALHIYWQAGWVNQDQELELRRLRELVNQKEV